MVLTRQAFSWTLIVDVHLEFALSCLISIAGNPNGSIFDGDIMLRAAIHHRDKCVKGQIPHAEKVMIFLWSLPT